MARGAQALADDSLGDHVVHSWPWHPYVVPGGVREVGAPQPPVLTALSARERAVAELVGLGYSNKHIAYELGLSLSSVATHLRRAKAKLQVDSSAALARLVPRDPGARLDAPTTHPLTESELEVVTLTESGLSTRAIAERRGTSPRTVAKQLTSIYTKLGVRSRRELLALPGRAGIARS